MIFEYTGPIEELTIFGYDFTGGQCEIDSPHFQRKLSKLPDFKAVKEVHEAAEDGETKLTVPQIKEILDKREIEYKVNASKPELMALLNGSDNDENEAD